MYVDLFNGERIINDKEYAVMLVKHNAETDYKYIKGEYLQNVLDAVMGQYYFADNLNSWWINGEDYKIVEVRDAETKRTIAEIKLVP